MDRLRLFSVSVLIFVSLTACAGITQMQDSVSRFDQATHAAATAESAFLNAVMTVDCENQFYESALNYSVAGKDSKTGINLRGYCSPSIITAEQIETRNALMNAVVLYADKMQALASSDDNKQLDGNSQAVAKNLDKLATAGGIQLKTPETVHGVEAAVVALAEMALDRVRFSDLKTAARSMQPNLATVVAALKTENYAFGQAMSGAFGGIEMVLLNGIAQSHAGGNSKTAETFFHIVNSRSILISADPVTKQSLAATGKEHKEKPVDVSKPLNDALDAIVTGNKAIADAGPGGIYAAAADLYKRAMAAKDLYGAISATKK